MASQSIVQDKKECIVCHSTIDLHRHHIFFGNSLRRKSEKYGFVVWLCPWHHNASYEGVHYNRTLDIYLKQLCQQTFEKTHSREEFMSIIGRNYL